MVFPVKGRRKDMVVVGAAYVVVVAMLWRIAAGAAAAANAPAESSESYNAKFVEI